ncbi:saccharopine dehydrogenase family protein [Hymenobacter terrenus]|uniref:saccharopine dehydrogenase family protein n=1 Tax=Hymenobacter terrenus TaxID=1629124 RepID=UPI000619F8F1|nr:NAD(P)H-binding protein [Hymenobacter terrenus]
MKPAGAHRPILVYGASGHTGRFIVSELLEHGFTPVLSGRDEEKLAALSSAHGGLKVRAAALNDRDALREALHGVAAVINAAGPFAETAAPVVEAALHANVPYLDVAAEPDIVAATMAMYGEPAQRAGLALAPGIGFYGGLGNLLATAALGDWPQADEITLAYFLSSWKPTLGTRATIEVAEKRRGGQRLVFHNQQLELRNDAAPITEWDFPAPIGKQTVSAEFTTADAVTMSHHLQVREIAEYMTLAPLRDLSDRDLSHPPAVDARGRSAQTFLVEAVVRRDNQRRRAVAQGQDIYAVTAPLAVQALLRLLAPTQPLRGVITAGELGDARSFLEALAPQHLTLYIETEDIPEVSGS